MNNYYNKWIIINKRRNVLCCPGIVHLNDGCGQSGHQRPWRTHLHRGSHHLRRTLTYTHPPGGASGETCHHPHPPGVCGCGDHYQHLQSSDSLVVKWISGWSTPPGMGVVIHIPGTKVTPAKSRCMGVTTITPQLWESSPTSPLWESPPTPTRYGSLHPINLGSKLIDHYFN